MILIYGKVLFFYLIRKKQHFFYDGFTHEVEKCRKNESQKQGHLYIIRVEQTKRCIVGRWI